MKHGIQVILDGQEYDFPKSKLEALLLLAYERVGGNGAALAAYLGVTKAAVNNWTRGRRKLAGDCLAKVIQLAVKGL